MHQRFAPIVIGCLLATRVSWSAPNFAWWNADWGYRVPVVVKAAVGEEKGAPAQVRLNFSALLKENERLDVSSVRVVEQDTKTGAVLAEVPCLFQPLDSPWAGIAPISWSANYDGKTPPLIRASSEDPLFPAKSLVTSGPGWQPATPTPPWSAALDLGAVKTINTVFVRVAYNGNGQGIPSPATLETATESADGLREGDWQQVGGWAGLSGTYLNGFMRPFCFTPRKARYVRLTLGGVNADKPRIAQFSVYAPFWDPDTRAEGRVSWFTPGLTGAQERTFFVYFDRAGAAPKPAPPLPKTVALFREAEEAINLFSPPGVGFQKGFDAQASGPTNPNMLTYSYPKDHFYPPAGFAVTLPQAGKYTIHLRVRGSLRDHQIRVLWDTTELFNGTFSVEGEGWSVVSLPSLEFTAGTHYLELMLHEGSERPMDLDFVLLTNDLTFTPTQCLLATPGRVEVRP